MQFMNTKADVFSLVPQCSYCQYKMSTSKRKLHSVYAHKFKNCFSPPVVRITIIISATEQTNKRLSKTAETLQFNFTKLFEIFYRRAAENCKFLRI